METNASNEGVGGVICQEHEIISYFSKKFNSTEKNYTIVEKKMYAIVFCLEKGRNMVLGNYIEIFTDNRNSIFQAEGNLRIKRWQLLLNEYTYELKQISGKDNVIADKLSRVFIIEDEKLTIQEKKKKLC